MPTLSLTRRLLPALALLALCPPALAAGAAPIHFLPSSRIWLTGTSTLHPFSCEARQWHVAASLVPALAKDGPWPGHERLASLEATVEARGLASGDGLMDTNMRAALQADRHPRIRFSMQQASLRETGPNTADATATGRLAIAAAEHPITLTAHAHLEAGTLHVWGQTPVSMASYGVTPPALLLGAIKVGDAITVHFDLFARP